MLDDVSEPAADAPETVEFVLHDAGQIWIRVPRHLEHDITTALKSDPAAVGTVRHQLQESAVLGASIIVIGVLADIAAVVQLVLACAGQDRAPRIKYTRRKTGAVETETFEAKGYKDPESLAELVHALRSDATACGGHHTQ